MLSFENRNLAQLHWPLVLVTTVIASLGVWNLASASRTMHQPVWTSQLVWLGVGALVAAVLLRIDYRWLLTVAYPLYGVVLVLLVGVLVRGRTVMGARRWLDLGPVHMQPSELAKIAVILALARYFHEDENDKGYTLTQLWLPGLLLLVPVALIAKEPDLGTALVTLAIGASIILFAKVRLSALITILVGTLGSAVAGWFWFFKAYQKKRVMTFLNPEGDALGAGYHAMQSVIAVGSGQVTGKGWGEGTQNLLSFLPEQRTDFIFSVWAEEHGFVGGAVLITLFAVLVLLGLDVADKARERFGAFLAVGVSALFFWHAFINIGMVTGVVPVVGVTLPLMSYGGSSVIVNLLGLGIVLNVSLRRFMF